MSAIRRQAQKIYKWFRTEVDPGFRSPAVEFDDHVIARLEKELALAEKRAAKPEEPRIVHLAKEAVVSAALAFYMADSQMARDASMKLLGSALQTLDKAVGPDGGKGFELGVVASQGPMTDVDRVRLARTMIGPMQDRLLDPATKEELEFLRGDIESALREIDE